MSETIFLMINNIGYFKSYIIIKSYISLKGESIEIFSAI